MPVHAAAGEPVRLMRPWLTELNDEGQCGDDIYYSYDADSETVTVEGTGETWDYDYSLGPTTVSRIFKVNGDVRTLMIGEGITEIKAVFIPENETLETIVVPESVVKIGNSNFHYNQPVTIVYEGTRAEWDAIDIDKNNGFKGCVLICAGEWFSAVSEDHCFNPRYLAFNKEALEEPDHMSFRPCRICRREEIAERITGETAVKACLGYTDAGDSGGSGNRFKDPAVWAANGWITKEYGVTLKPYTCCSVYPPVTILYRCC